MEWGLGQTWDWEMPVWSLPASPSSVLHAHQAWPTQESVHRLQGSLLRTQATSFRIKPSNAPNAFMMMPHGILNLTLQSIYPHLRNKDRLGATPLEHSRGRLENITRHQIVTREISLLRDYLTCLEIWKYLNRQELIRETVTLWGGGEKMTPQGVLSE